jgi:uncharacterized protein (TIGR02996 family)
MAKKKATLADAFLRDISEHPEDDAPRLIYADWLDENGQPERAEFIRLQCRLAGHDEDAPERPALVEREQALLHNHGEVWKAEVPTISGVSFSDFQRGFLHSARIDLNRWKKGRERKVAALFAAAPVEELTLDDATPAQLSSLLDNPAALRLHKLEFFDLETPVEIIRRIADSPHVRNLRRLDFFDLGLDDTALVLLASSPNLANLREFFPVDCGPFGAEGLRALARSPYLTRLTNLYLHLAEPYLEGVAILAGAANLVSLRELDIVADLGPAGLELLASSPHLTELREFQLHGTGLGDVGMPVLARAGWRSLRQLDLSLNTIGDEGARVLATWPGLATVRKLYLRHNVIGPTGIQALAASTYLGQLVELELAKNQIGVEGAAALARADLPNLRVLGLWGCHIGDEGVRQIADSPNSSRLTKLCLADNNLTDAGAEALLHSPNLGGITRLEVLTNALSAARKKALVKRFGDVWL